MSDYGAGALLGMIGGHQQERRNYRNNQNLMNLQNQYQRGLNQQGHELQMDMWNKTNYGAQVGHMKNAGLNPALMYKGAGAGGTTGSQGGGSASMGSSQQGKVMDLQNALLGAQIGKLKAETQNIDANTGLTGSKIKSVDQDVLEAVERTSNLKTQGEIMQFEKDIKEAEKKRADKGTIKGDLLGNILDVAGLDPKNNEEHRKLLIGLFGVQYATRIIGDLAGAYGKAKTGGYKGKKSPQATTKATVDRMNNVKNQKY